MEQLRLSARRGATGSWGRGGDGAELRVPDQHAEHFVGCRGSDFSEPASLILDFVEWPTLDNLRRGASLSPIDGASLWTMSVVTLTLPDLPEDIAERVRALADRLPRALTIALRALDEPVPPKLDSIAEVTDFLTSVPSPEQTLAFRPSPALQARIFELLEKNRTSGLSAEEQREWQAYELAEHWVRMAKANAAAKLAGK